MKRAKVNDPVALLKAGVNCQEEGDYEGAIEYYTKAAGLGDIGSHQNLSNMYYMGNGVEKDLKKAVYHLEVAAIGGHPYARYNLGNHEGRNGRHERAYKHFIIAAKLGLDMALEMVKQGFAHGFVSNEDYAAALCGHQAAVDATKSEQREEAEKYHELFIQFIQRNQD
jgi:TPR repeat protein